MGRIVLKNKPERARSNTVGYPLALSVFTVVLLLGALTFGSIHFISQAKNARATNQTTHIVALHAHRLVWVPEHPTYTLEFQSGQPFDFTPPIYDSSLRFMGWSLDPDEFIVFNMGTPVTQDLVLFAEWV